jgi:hypothetical protein
MSKAVTDTSAAGAAIVLGEAGADDTMDVGKTLGTLSSAISDGYKIYEFFAGDSKPNLSDLAGMIAKLPDQIRTVIRQEETLAEITNATAAADDASTWLTIDYKNLLRNFSPGDIYSKNLTAGDGLSKLNTLELELSKMERWTHSEIPGDQQLATQTISVYLALANLILVFYQERARNAPTPAAQNDELSNIKDRASNYVSHATDLLTKAFTARIAAVDDVTVETFSCGFKDHWLTDDFLVSSVDAPGLMNHVNDDDQASLMGNLRTAHLALLKTGGEKEYRTLRAVFVQNVNFAKRFFQNDYRSTYMKKIREFGKWYVSCSATVANITKLETNPLPTLPADKTNGLPNVEFSFTLDGSVNPPSGSKKLSAPLADGAFYPQFILQKSFDGQPGYHETWAWGFTYYPDNKLEVAYGRWLPEMNSLVEEALISQPITLDVNNLSQQTSVSGYDSDHPDYTVAHAEAHFSFD